jgi:hypothetical protein
VAGRLSGAVSKNVFTHNFVITNWKDLDLRAKGGAVYLADVEAGEVNSNFFSGNHASNYGGDLFVGAGTTYRIPITNNLFLRNSMSRTLPRGFALYSEHPFAMLGNTFHGADSGGAAIYLQNIEFSCDLRNNIFSNLPLVLELRGEVDAQVVSNSFHGTDNVLFLDHTGMSRRLLNLPTISVFQ